MACQTLHIRAREIMFLNPCVAQRLILRKKKHQAITFFLCTSTVNLSCRKWLKNEREFSGHFQNEFIASSTHRSQSLLHMIANYLCQLGLESLQNFKIKFVKCYCLILSTKQIKGNLRTFAMIPKRTLLVLLLFSELQHF